MINFQLILLADSFPFQAYYWMAMRRELANINNKFKFLARILICNIMHPRSSFISV